MLAGGPEIIWPTETVFCINFVVIMHVRDVDKFILQPSYIAVMSGVVYCFVAGRSRSIYSVGFCLSVCLSVCMYIHVCIHCGFVICLIELVYMECCQSN